MVFLEMFAQESEVTRLETALPPTDDAQRLAVLLPLAWHLRQRDMHRALLLAEQIDVLLVECVLSPVEQQQTLARLALIRGEAKWLLAELDAAQILGEWALQAFIELSDDLGCADAHWLLGWVAADHGDLTLQGSARNASAEAALRGGDALRAEVTNVAMAIACLFQDVRDARQRWASLFAGDLDALHPALRAWIGEFRGVHAALLSDFGGAAQYFMQSYEAALETGQLRRAVIIATNIGDTFNSLNEHYGALGWMQRSLDLAIPCGWPSIHGICLMQTAETQRRLGRLDAAHELLCEALVTLEPLAGSRNHATALEYLGDVMLARHDFVTALDIFRQLQVRADALNHADFQTDARRGQAHALYKLGQAEAAREVALAALEFARQRNDSFRQIRVLKVLAKIHAGHAFPVPAGSDPVNYALQYLHDAIDIANQIDGYTVGDDLLDALAREHAHLGDYAQAYHIGLEANCARKKTHSQEATNRAIAIQVQHQTERTRAEGDYHRQLAASEAKRAEILHQTSTTLRRLSAIGQEITSNLNVAVVFQALSRHVHGLLDASAFLIFMLEPDGRHLRRTFAVEHGKTLPIKRIALSDADAVSAQCVRERREISRQWDEGDCSSLIPGTLPCRSTLFIPLVIGDRLIGVMSIQSVHPNAYGDREQLIFRTLCAYGAIALDNANAYLQLKEAHQYLLEQEKLAALGALVAGVAHELNTPIGNCLMITTALQEKTTAISGKIRGPSLQRRDLLNYLSDAEEAAAVVRRGLHSAADLVASFKQVAVDRTTAQRREFDLHQTSHEIIATMNSQIKLAGHEMILDVPEGIAMTSYPGPFGQVISNLINNALLHAFEGRNGGKIRIVASQVTPEWVSIGFSDDGCGIPQDNLGRIFDPFFTTKMGKGGSGLGLSISYNIVTQFLGGHIAVASAPGQGTTFTLDLPLVVAPQSDQQPR